jgi:hypothetical protein
MSASSLDVVLKGSTTTSHKTTGEPRVTRRTSIALLVGTMWIGLAASETTSETIGGTKISLPYPDGYVDLCSTDADAASDFVLAIPPTNQLLGCYTTPRDYAEWKSGSGGVFSSHLISSVVKQTINGNVTSEQFGAFKQQAKASIDTLYASMAPQIREQLDKAVASIAQKYSAKVEIAPGAVVPLGVFDEGQNHFSSIWLASADVSSSDGVVKSKKVQISSTVLSKGKVFVLFTYGEYLELTDIEKYKNVAKAWVSAFTKENP